MSNFAENVGEGFGKGLIAYIFLAFQIIPLYIVYRGVTYFLLASGAIEDLQTTVFALLISLGFYNLYEIQYTRVDRIATDALKSKEMDLLQAKVDTILALTDDLADE